LTELEPSIIYTTPGGGRVSFSKHGDLAIHTDKGFKSLPLLFWEMAYDSFFPSLIEQIEHINNQIASNPELLKELGINND